MDKELSLLRLMGWSRYWGLTHLMTNVLNNNSIYYNFYKMSKRVSEIISDNFSEKNYEN